MTLNILQFYTTTTSFDYEAVKNLYNKKRTAYVDGRLDRRQYVGEESRVVFVEAVAPISTGTYADVIPRIVSIPQQNRVVYAAKNTR